ncbi:phosphoadenosine phosphosulfate reductase family protein [Pseudoduganella sp. R-34]|uniref:phosphoadenosine phosphosulfate reductase domain-containing protein n=1 Tax=Pseudoduganella sp. R-34 TaxID=3404062 RepID=UPI003CFA3391
MLANIPQQVPARIADPSNWLAYLRTLVGIQLNYQLPGNPETDQYIIPVSGGADSSLIAILMHLLYPGVRFVLVFTDTVAEEPGIYVTLDDLEAFLGRSITRLTPELGLFELIEAQGGFLPSHSARWCTRILKLENFKPWLESQGQYRQRHMFIGIRADEQDRLAFAIDDVETHFPFIDMGLKREHVFQMLRETIGIPRYYARRTRSGCSDCFYQRRTEKVGLMQEQPIIFNRGAKYEKLGLEDSARHKEAPPLWRDSGISENWQRLPLPTSDARKFKNRLKRGTSIFGDRGIYIGGEFFFDSFLGLNEFVWAKRILTYSPTLAGIKDQLNERFQHLLATSEVHDMTPDQVRHDVRFAIWYVELPADVFDPDPPTGESYTWQKGESYRQLRHIIQWATRALQAEGMQQVASIEASPLSVEYEWAEESKNALKRVQHATGRVVASMWYRAIERVKELDLEEAVRSTPCPMCSI